MRSNVHALTDWVTKNELLQCVGLKASDITGTSNQAGHMTQIERLQLEALRQRQMEEEKKLAKQNENLPETVLMLCKNCDQPLCRGQPH
ncbi:unnamed protein product [Lampetra fluviatilis]